MLVADGVFPSNEAAATCCAASCAGPCATPTCSAPRSSSCPNLVDTAIDVMAPAYPVISKSRDLVLDVITREEERFRQTLKTGLTILDDELATGRRHAAAGQPRPSAARHLRLPARGHPGDHRTSVASRSTVAGFNAEMDQQRERAKDARKAGTDDETRRAYRERRRAVRHHGVRRLRATAPAEAWPCCPADPLADGTRQRSRSSSTAPRSTPRAGGQVGDTGTITTPTGTADRARHHVRPARPAPPRRHGHDRHHRPPASRPPP